MSFPKPTLELFDRAREVDIETRSSTGRKHSVPIWVVVDGDDVFIRTYLGKNTRWYREVLAGPGALVVRGKRVRVKALPASDAASVKRASEGYRRKYKTSRSLDFMLLPKVLPTTLRLEPDSSS